jgi:predicted PurR-regulated permease PerM
MERLRLEISWGSLWKVAAITALLALLFAIRETIIVLLVAILISSALDPLVEKLEKWRMPRVVGTIAIFVVTLTLLALLTYTIVPLSIIEFRDLFANLGGAIGQILGTSVPNTFINSITPQINSFANSLLAGNASFVDVLGNVLGGVTLLIVTIILSFYLTVTRDGVGKFIRAILPRDMEDKALSTFYRSKHKISRWVNGQLVLALIMATAVFFGLLFLGVKYALILAIFAGVFEIVPLVGPIFAGALSIAVALNQSAGLALSVLILFIILQQVEAHALVPLVMKRSVDVHPVVVIVAILIGNTLAGIPGMFLAVPAAVVFQEIVDDWVAKKDRQRESETVEV